MGAGDEELFRSRLRGARKVTVLTGAGVSAESGIPTFRSEDGLWKRYDPERVASTEAMQKHPDLVWDFHERARRLMRAAEPNPAHRAIAQLEARWAEAGGTFTLITQNIDGLHERAGSRNVVRIHGSAWEARCLVCGEITQTPDIPIAPAFADLGAPGERTFTEVELPHCACGGLLRPNTVFFGESVASKDLVGCADAIDKCHLMIIAGTSAIVYPAAGLVPLAKRYGTALADINVEPSGVSDLCDFVFHGKAGELLPALLDVTPAW